MIRFSTPWTAAAHVVCIVVSLTMLLPLLLAFGASFKPDNEVNAALPWPTAPTLANYVRVFEELPFARYLWNSLVTTTLRVTGQVALAALAAYAFTRWQFRGRDMLFLAVLGAMMIPHSLTMVPLYIMMAQLGWFDTYLALVIPNLAAPFAVFFLRQHMMSFPKELIDSAELDGAGSLRVLWSVMVPNLRPALAALSIILFLECWNEYFWPLIVTESAASMTAQVGLRKFLNEELGNEYGPLMAAATLVCLPVIVLFFLAQRRVMETFVASGLKG
ncbi:MAG: carbohydrate ABC transporter permease [Planctomycetes bacterium]|nr:carbohydrate ABC transporter permease [Planctomycetota bacterium]